MNRFNKIFAYSSVFLISLCLLVVFLLAFRAIPFGADTMDVGHFYLEDAAKSTGSANIVTAVVLGFRGFDTLGEVMVLFLGAVGLGLVLSSQKDSTHSPAKTFPSLILKTMADLVFPFIVLFGIYIFMHGHISPGGGFPAGAVLASGYLLLFLSQRGGYHIRLAQRVETGSGLVFVIVGLAGLYFSGFFLHNFLPVGRLGSLYSAGIIPVLYSLIGIKVGAELGGIIYRLFGE